jgi:raffinose/stachyose/melibiose transport system substrate-binding protein
VANNITFRGASNPTRTALRTGLAGIAIASMIGLVGCAPGGQDVGTNTGGEISKDVPTDEEINLTLAHWEVGGNGEAIEALIDAYEEKHPNVTIDISFASFNDYGQRIKLQMSEADAPDIAQAGQAFTMMGPLVEGGLLRPLDDYAELYGWADRFGPGLLDQARFESDGSKFGTGDLYGLALGGNMVGIFYNRAVVEELGIDPDFETLEDFDAALAAAKEGGYVPMALGNADAWPANHLLSSLISQYADNADMLSWIFGNDGASFESDSFLAATEHLERWAADGLIDPAANGLSFDDAISRFAAGDSAFFVTGNWALATMQDQMGDNVGFTAFPGLSADAPARATGATTSPFTISAATDYPDVAANFLDFMTGPEAADILSNGGYAPLTPGAEVAGDTELIADYNEVWSDVLADDGLTLFLDWSTVAMGNTLFPSIQELLAGRIAAADLASSVQAEWENGR